MKDKIEIVAGILIAVAVLTTLYFYLTSVGHIGSGEISVAVIALILVVFAIYVLWDRLKNVQRGLPSKDERLININHKAGYYAFIAAIWSAVGVPMLSDFLFHYELEGSRVGSAVVIISGFVFAISYLYMERKGN